MSSHTSSSSDAPGAHPAPSRLPFAIALATAVATFALLLLGSTVHVTGSSLACPDWPLCYGQVMPEMKGGVAIEHSHRLLASAVGLLTIALTVVLFARRSASRWLSLGALVLVIGQGVLGGLTVLYLLPTAISSAHLATSMVYFSLLVWITLRVRREGRVARAVQTAIATPLPSAWPVLAAAGFVWVQMILGALVRHTGAALACADELPLCRSFGWPTLWPAEGPGQLHMTHRIVGTVVGTAVVVLCAWIVARARKQGDRALVAAAAAPLVLVLVQIGLGVGNVLLYSGPVIATAHLGGGALLLVSLVSLAFGLAARRATIATPASSRTADAPELRPDRVAA
ncbi:MAG: COX15/CtaA family protein [Deltaproteobacteria bacterium]|nr:COX15/CtaA family protein [Deltaproteobacteria bacterium]